MQCCAGAPIVGKDLNRVPDSEVSKAGVGSRKTIVTMKGVSMPILSRVKT